MRVLIIEDEDTLREQICERFKEEGFAIDAAGDGDEGLYLAREMPIDGRSFISHSYSDCA